MTKQQDIVIKGWVKPLCVVYLNLQRYYNMKGHSKQDMQANFTSLPKQKPQLETMRIDLKVKLPHLELQPTISRTKLTHSKSKEESLQLQLSDRTRGVNQFLLTNKESALPFNKFGNIKSYLRIKPNKSTFMPFGIYSNQNIVYDRSVYKFDYIFDQEAQQAKVYDIVCKEVTQRFIEGYNGTIFAYGSTGSGKTYTMFGNDDGLVPSVVSEIFSKLSPNDKLSCSMIEIYRQNLIDLLCENEVQLKIKEINNVCTIQNLSVHDVCTQQGALQLIKKGNHLKKIRETDLNESSSRSHIVFTFHLDKIDAKGRPIKAKFNLVDLAGSEKVCKSKVQGEGLEEAKKINLSLSCLGNTISALVKNSEHIPYRQSKLTRILKESLMGNSITRLIVTCSITEESIEETISSIKFAQRAQKVQTQSQVAYNINKFKGDKEEREKLVRLALQKAEDKLKQVAQLMACEEQTVCERCKLARQILSNRESQFEEIFNFNPMSINSFLSPKSSINIKSFFTNPSERMSSVSKRGLSKRRDVQANKDFDNEISDIVNKKTFEMKLENNKFRQEKDMLEQKLKKLQQRCMVLQKANKVQKPNKKVIKLGINDVRNTKVMKQNQPNLVNGYLDPNTKKNSKECTFKTEEIQSNKSLDFLNGGKEYSKINQLQSAVTVIKECIFKFESASQQYKSSILPLQLNVLEKQVLLLRKKITQQSQGQISESEYTLIFQSYSMLISLHNQLKKSLSSYYFSIALCLDRLFEISQYEFKQDHWSALEEREKDVENVLYKCKQIIDQGDELAVLNNLLQKSKMIGLVKEKERFQSNEDKQFRQLRQSYNEFLDLKHFQTSNVANIS